MREIDHIIIHCAETPPDMDIGAAEIDRWHRARGWWGNGYHYVIRRDGTVESAASGKRCRPLEKAGAHVGNCGAGWNKRSIGICLVGGCDKHDKEENNFTPEQWTSLKDLVEFLRTMFKDTVIMGHRDLIKLTNSGQTKYCPSFDVSTWLEHVGISPK